MKKRKIFSMEKLMSAAVYFVMLSVAITEFTRYYSYNILIKNNALANPLCFAIITLTIGILVSGVHRGINTLLRLISRQKSDILDALDAEERTMIGFAVCLMVGGIVYYWSQENSEFAVVYQMLFSLPVAKLGFITTSCKELWTDIRKLVMKSISVWPFLLYIVFEAAIHMYLEEYVLIINLPLMLGIIAFLAVSACRQGKKNSDEKTVCDK